MKKYGFFKLVGIMVLLSFANTACATEEVDICKKIQKGEYKTLELKTLAKSGLDIPKFEKDFKNMPYSSFEFYWDDKPFIAIEDFDKDGVVDVLALINYQNSKYGKTCLRNYFKKYNPETGIFSYYDKNIDAFNGMGYLGCDDAAQKIIMIDNSYYIIRFDGLMKDKVVSLNKIIKGDSFLGFNICSEGELK